MTYYPSGMTTKLGLLSVIGSVIGSVMVSLLFLASDPVAGQSLRDPTVPPQELVVDGSSATGLFQGTEADALTIIVRNGRPHLVINRLFYAEGEKIGEVLIERITETEVWLRTGGVLRKVSQYPGIKRSTATP